MPLAKPWLHVPSVFFNTDTHAWHGRVGEEHDGHPPAEKYILEKAGAIAKKWGKEPPTKGWPQYNQTTFTNALKLGCSTICNICR